MRSGINKLAAKTLARVLGEKEAGACIPNDPYYTCYYGAYMYCTNNCLGQYTCTQVGSCKS